MDRWLSWLKKHKPWTWVFSGVGVALVGWVLNGWISESQPQLPETPTAQGDIFVGGNVTQNYILERNVVPPEDLDSTLPTITEGFKAFNEELATSTSDNPEVEEKVVDIENVFSPSGWMGDGEYKRKYIDFTGADSTKPFTPPSSVRVTYRFGPERWAGIYWLNKPDNWGDKPGFDYTGKGISRVTFWARGSLGNEVIEFKSGDVDSGSKRFRDSFGATTGRVRLSKNWKKFDINLSGEDLSSVIGGFCWVASQDYNSGKMITFYLDEISFR